MRRLERILEPPLGERLRILSEEATSQSDPVKRVALPGDYIVATLPKGWKLGSKQILVRSKYNKAEKGAVLLSNKPNCDVFVVPGQPGIDPRLLSSLPAESNT